MAVAVLLVAPCSSWWSLDVIVWGVENSHSCIKSEKAWLFVLWLNRVQFEQVKHYGDATCLRIVWHYKLGHMCLDIFQPLSGVGRPNWSGIFKKIGISLFKYRSVLIFLWHDLKFLQRNANAELAFLVVESTCSLKDSLKSIILWFQGIWLGILKEM